MEFLENFHPMERNPTFSNSREEHPIEALVGKFVCRFVEFQEVPLIEDLSCTSHQMSSPSKHRRLLWCA